MRILPRRVPGGGRPLRGVRGEPDRRLPRLPLPGHPNSETAAAAVEAAAQQGRFKEMHASTYETQTEWSHTAEDRSPVFRGYAEDLGLDMAAYDAAIADPATMERVNADKKDGMALTGGPAFPDSRARSRSG